MTVSRILSMACWSAAVVLVLGGMAMNSVTSAAEDEKKGDAKAKPTAEKPAADKPAADKPAADEKAKEKAEKVDPYALPEGGVAELVKFIEKLQTMRPTSREEFIEMRTKQPPALKAAAEKIVSLEKDKESSAYQKAQDILLMLEVQSLSRATPEESKKVFHRVLDALKTKKEMTRNELSLAFMTAQSLEHSGQDDLALEAYNQFGAIFKVSKDKAMAGYGEKMIGSARRMKLLGNEMEVFGTLIDGSEFSWKSYRGKVVLVDFWATWCGPCIAELPNVKNAYELYHPKGFDVVGISLDTDKERLETFLEEKSIPWACLFQDEAGWNNPMANYYGVMGIPTVILVDQKGKVVSMRARGPVLMQELEKLLGPVEKKEEVKKEDEKKEDKKSKSDSQSPEKAKTAEAGQ